jgi:DNA gyrase inhibitor GyrI
MADGQNPERKPIAEIEALYPNHWILIDDPETDDQLRVISGIVVRAGENRDDVRAGNGDLKSGRYALHCTRKGPAGVRYLLWPFHLTSTTPSSR